MSYKQLLNKISKNVFELDNNQDEILNIIDSETIDNINIYKRNLIGALLKSFEQDFPITKKYLGERIFLFLIRGFIQSKGISKENIFEVSQSFPSYIDSMKKVHEDDFLVYLATLDLFWNQFELQGLNFSIPKGIKEYWDCLERDISPEAVTIDFTKFETLMVQRLGAEKHLVLASS